MENSSERNEFYLYLLNSSGRNKGSSAANKTFQKDFEEAMRLDTRNRSKERKKESAKSRKENSGKTPLNNDKFKALDFINKYSKKK